MGSVTGFVLRVSCCCFLEQLETNPKRETRNAKQKDGPGPSFFIGKRQFTYVNVCLERLA